jgi:hypothetical protein
VSFDADDFEDEGTQEAHERRIKRCQSGLCRARIIFMPTANGRIMPCDADSVEPIDQQYIGAKHVSHFKTCSDPNRFSGSKKK